MKRTCRIDDEDSRNTASTIKDDEFFQVFQLLRRRRVRIGGPITREFWPERAYANAQIPKGEFLRLIRISDSQSIVLETRSPVVVDLFFANSTMPIEQFVIEHHFDDGNCFQYKPGMEWNAQSHLFVDF